MKTTEEIHRENLHALAKEFAGVAAVADKIGCSSSQYSQWLNGSKNSGTGKPRGLRPSSARKIEKACGKPEGWMDRTHSERVPAQAMPPTSETPESAVQAPDAGTGLAESLKLTCETAAELRMLTVYRLTDNTSQGIMDDLVERIRQRLDDQGLWHKGQSR